MAKTLLLADDSVTIQKVVNISFASEDVTLVTVDNGDDAVTRAREILPDVILADVVMPGKNGYEVCEAVKGDPALAHIPVLLLTGTFESFDEERALRAGAAGHVAKPFEAQILVSRVKELLAAAPAPAPPPAPAVTDTPPIVPPDAVTEPRAADPGDSDSFDFFDDDLADLAPAATPADAGDALPDDTDSAFAFVGDDRAPASASDDLADALAAAPPDHTVAMMPEEPVGGLDPLAAPEADEAGEDSFSPMVEANLDDESFDFSQGADFAEAERAGTSDTLLDDGLEGVEMGDVAQATVLDPNGASGYDVSSSDLGMPLLDDAPLADATPVGDEPARAGAASDAGPDWDAGSAWDPGSAPDAGADWEAEPSWDAVEAGDEPVVAAPAEIGADLDPMPRARVDADFDADLGADSDAPAAVFDDSYASLAASDEAVRAEPARPLPAGAAASADSLLAAMAPALREQLHDTLEKMAWESFGAVTEKIVSETVDRLEKIAWEVIPQLAEALIREEIRRLKGEDAD